ncbi:MAG: response regulator transcription factor [Clostridiales bacterium]|nr:response regulator transcription factor [Clostridiales bacterium]
MQKGRILVVEDEIKLARFLELELRHEGYEVLVTHDGREGLRAALEENVSLVVLDIMLPVLNGMEVCRRIRHASDIPVIMLTAKDDTMDKVMGLDLGADDYMTKPFAIEELLARIRAILKRRGGTAAKGRQLNAGDLVIDTERYQAFFRKQPVELTKREFELLKYLVENRNIVLTRDTLLREVWGYDYAGDTNVVDVYIRYLRSKIDQRFDTNLIRTVRGVGYILENE